MTVDDRHHRVVGLDPSGQEVAGVGRLRRQKAGFSLLEVVVALVIFGLILIPLTISFVLGMQVVTAATLTNKATGIAEGKMEELRTEGYHSIKSSYDDGEYPTDPPLTVTQGNSEFRVVIDVSESGSLLEIAITVDWEDRGRPTSLTVESLIGPD